MNKLENIKKQNNFKVPKDYFEDLPFEIQKKIDVNTNFSFKSLRLKPLFTFAITFASIVLIWFTVLSNIDFGIKNIPSTSVVAENNIIDFEDEYYMDNLNEKILIDVYVELADSVLNNKTNDILNDDEIIEYLSNQNLDDYLLAEAF